MKKILILCCFLCLVGCAPKEKTPLEKKQDLYKEVSKIEKNMKKIEYFKMNKIVDEEYLVCNGDSAALTQPSKQVKVYNIHQKEGKIEFISTQSVEDEIQFKTQYYRNNQLYTSYSQLPYNISKEEAIDDYVYMDVAIKGIDLKYYDLKKTKNGEEKQYTFTLVEPEKFNAKYPQDFDDKTCGLVGDYRAQRITLKVDKEGKLIEEEIVEKIHYQSANTVSERENTRVYIFYEYTIENALNFDIITPYE